MLNDKGEVRSFPAGKVKEGGIADIASAVASPIELVSQNPILQRRRRWGLTFDQV